MVLAITNCTTLTSKSSSFLRGRTLGALRTWSSSTFTVFWHRCVWALFLDYRRQKRWWDRNTSWRTWVSSLLLSLAVQICSLVSSNTGREEWWQVVCGSRSFVVVATTCLNLQTLRRWGESRRKTFDLGSCRSTEGSESTRSKRNSWVKSWMQKLRWEMMQ